MYAKITALSRTTFSSLKTRNFRLFFIGQGISLTGGWMQGVAQSWLILHLTGSATALGISAALQYAPMLFLGPYAGVLADRFPKRRILFITQSISALLALSLGVAVATGAIRAWMVYVMAGVLGLVTAVDYPTRQSFLSELVGRRELLSAVGLTGTIVNLARVAGPAIAGVLIAVAGLAACFFLNAASFIAVLVCLVAMRPIELHRAPADQLHAGLIEGLTYVRHTPVVREALVMMALIGMLTYEFGVTLPAFAKFTLDSGAAGLALLMAAMGAGAAIGGLLTAGRRGDGLGRLAAASLAFGVSTALVGLSPSLNIASIFMFVAGVFSARFTGLSNAILQLQSAPAMRNRVMALWSTAFLGSAFLGGPLVGWLAEAAGPRWALGVGALGGIVAAGIGWRGARHAPETVSAESSIPIPVRREAIAASASRERAHEGRCA